MSNFIDKFSLAGKKAIVTGGAKGLCNGMAQALHDAGAEGVLLEIPPGRWQKKVPWYMR